MFFDWFICIVFLSICKLVQWNYNTATDNKLGLRDLFNLFSFIFYRVDRNKYQIHIPLPPKIDPTVTMMQVEEKPDVTYSDVGGCKEQIEKLREVVETPLLHVWFSFICEIIISVRAVCSIFTITTLNVCIEKQFI